MINVLLIEDSAVFVLGLKLALSGNPAFGSVESVASPGAAVAFLNAHPETDIAVVVLSHYKNPAYIMRAITSGACAYLAKDSSPESIVEAIGDVAAGKCLFFGETIDSEKILRLFDGRDNLDSRKPQGLTPRELEVLQLTSSGYSNSQIASALDISLNTVDSYKERIKGKFGLDSIVECVATAAAKGIVSV